MSNDTRLLVGDNNSLIHNALPQKLRCAFIDVSGDPVRPGRSGLSDVVWDMASELASQGHEAHIIGAYAVEHFPDPRVIVHNFATPSWAHRNVIGLFWRIAQAFNVVKQIEPDIVHAPEYVSTAVCSALRVPYPMVMTVPGNIFYRLKTGHNYDWTMVQVFKWAAKVSARKCGAIIAISRDMKRWWEWTGSDPESTYYIPYGVDLERFSPTADSRARIGIDPQLCLFLYAGRFAREKGLFDLVDGVAHVQETFRSKHAKLLLIGDGPEKDDLEKVIRKYAVQDIINVKKWVKQDELKDWYSAADAFILPSWNEPLGRVILESMACGTPVISSATEGPKDHISDGQTGFLFPVKDTSGLVSILTTVIENQEILGAMGTACRTYVERNLTWERIMERIVSEVYHPLL